MRHRILVIAGLAGALTAGSFGSTLALISRNPDGPGRGHSAFSGQGIRLSSPVLNNGTVFFLSQAPDLDADWPDPGLSWDAFEARSEGGVRFLNPTLQANYGQATGVAAGGSVVVEVRWDTPVAPAQEIVFRRNLLTGTAAEVGRHARIHALRVSDTGLHVALLVGDSDGGYEVLLNSLTVLPGTRTSVAVLSTPGDDPAVDVGGTGDMVVFQAQDRLVDGDTNGSTDIFLWRAGSLERVNKRFAEAEDGLGLQTAYPCEEPCLSADGAYVFFSSRDPDLVAGDANGTRDIFAVDLASGENTRVNIPLGGGETDGVSRAPACNRDGRFVAFRSNASNLPGSRRIGGTPIYQIYVADRLSGAIACLSVDSTGQGANSDCLDPDISPDGRYVTFASRATNLASVTTDGTYVQVFRVDRGEDFLNTPPVALPVHAVCQENTAADAGNSCPVPLAGEDLETAASALSFLLDSLPSTEAGELRDSDGNAVSVGATLAPERLPLVFVPETGFSGSTSFEYRAYDGIEYSLLSAQVDIVVGDFAAGILEVASRNASGQWGNGHSPEMGDLGDTIGISDDGRFIVYGSAATNLSAEGEDGIFLRDTARNRTTLVATVPSDYSFRYTAMAGSSAALAYAVGGDLVWRALSVDGVLSTTVSLASAAPEEISLTTDGETVLFATYRKLVEEDVDSDRDVYVWLPLADTVELISAGDGEHTFTGSCHSPALSASGGGFVVFGNGNSIWMFDRQRRTYHEIVDGGARTPRSPSLSRTGRFLSVQLGTTVQVRDTTSGAIVTEIPAPYHPGNVSANPLLSADGRYVYLTSSSTSLELAHPGLASPDGAYDQAFRVDLVDGRSSPLSYSGGNYAPGHAYRGALSRTGRHVAFIGFAGMISPAQNNVLHALLADLGPTDNGLPTPTLSEVQATEDTLAEDVALTYVDPENNDVLVELTGPPAHAAEFEVYGIAPGRSDVVFSYLPEANFHGADAVSYRVGDGHGWSAAQVVTIKVQPVDDPPELSPLTVSPIQEGAQFPQIVLSAYLTEVDGDAVAWSWERLTSLRQGGPDEGLSVRIVGAVAAITIPHENWFGTETLRFRATDAATAAGDPIDNGLSASMDVVFTVEPVDDPPMLSAIAVPPIDEGGVFPLVDLGAHLTEVDGDEISWSWEHVAPGSALGVSIDAAGRAAITLPDENWHGSETVRFVVADQGTDNALSAAVDVLFTVHAVDDAPVLAPINLAPIPEGGVFPSIDLARHLTEVDGDAVAWSATVVSGEGAAQEGNLLVSVDAAGTAVVSPPSSHWNGTRTVRFTATDQTAAELSGSVDVVATVEPVDDPPLLARIPDQTIGRETGFSPISLDLFLTEYDGDAVTWTWSAPEALTLEFLRETGTVVLRAPDPSWIGAETVTFTVTDQTATQRSASVQAVFERKHHTILSLEPGWNPICLPLVLTATSGQRLQEAVTGPLWYWDGLMYRPVTVGGGRLPGGSSLLPGRGLWALYIGDTGREELELLGDIPPTFDIQLVDGWNLVGATGAGTQLVLPNTDGAGQAFRPRTVWSWEAGSYAPLGSALLQRNRAYWIRPEPGTSPTVRLELGP